MMESHPVVPVSVVIPCFRCSTTIGRAVKSVAQQTARPAEVILVDDASGDGTLPVLQELSQTYAGWVKVLQISENRGAASARNAGWEATSQPYIAFLDADDAWHIEKLRIQYEYMRDRPSIAVTGHRCILLRNEMLPSKMSQVSGYIPITPFRLLFRNAFSTPSVMLKRDIQFRFTENKRYCEDYDLWLQVAYGGLQIMFIEADLAYLYKAPYGASGLSAQLWKMEKGALDSFAHLYRKNKINLPVFCLACVFSIVKFGPRAVNVITRRIFQLFTMS